MAASTVFYIAIGIILMSRTNAKESDEHGECCPTFWTPFGEACYRLIATAETWADAEVKCQQLGNGLIPGMEGHLVSIHSKEESEFVQTYYESSVIVQHVQRRRIKTIKPRSYNSLWLGLNNQGADLDTFVWSDKTEISTTLWQDTLYNTNYNCGHMWTSPSKYEGKWNDASCSEKLPYMCKLHAQEDEHNGVIFTSKSVFSSSDGSWTIFNHLPCFYDGYTYLDGEIFDLDECTTCICDNSTVRLNIKTCAPTSCGEAAIRPEDECCDICPDDSVTVPEKTECYYQGSTTLQGQRLKLDDCTTCACSNSTLNCNVLACSVYFCLDQIDVDGACCDLCPYDVPVYDVQLSGVDSVTADVNDISVDLQVSLSQDKPKYDTYSILGSDLWKVGMWASRNADGSGRKIGLTEQVLTNRQASKNIQQTFYLWIPDINFSLDASGTSCEDIQYLCASFNQGDAPKTQFESQLFPVNVTRFNVRGVESAVDSSPNPSRLTDCQPFTNCIGRKDNRKAPSRKRSRKHKD